MDRDLSALDALRGFAAVAIAFSAWTAFSAGGIEEGARLHLFIDFFFVTSGFLTAEVYRFALRRPADLGAFAILRLARLYPVYLVLLAPLAVAAAIRMGAGDPALATRLASEMTLTTILNGAEGLSAMGWYVAAEFWVAIAFAAACMTGMMRSPSGRLALLALTGFAAVWLIGAGQAMDHQAGGAFARGVYGFGAGVAAHMLLRIHAFSDALAAARARAGWVLEAAVLIPAVLFIGLVRDGFLYAAPLVFCLIVLVFVDGRGPVSALLRAKPLQRLGALSYTIFISHALLLLPVPALMRWAGPEIGASAVDLSVGLYLVATILTALAAHRLVETPVRQCVRAWLDRQGWARQGVGRLAIA